VSEVPPAVSQARYQWLDLAITVLVFGGQVLLWVLCGEPLLIVLRWIGEHLGMSIRAVSWWCGIVGTAIVWAAYLIWDLRDVSIRELCGMACL